MIHQFIQDDRMFAELPCELGKYTLVLDTGKAILFILKNQNLNFIDWYSIRYMKRGCALINYGII